MLVESTGLEARPLTYSLEVIVVRGIGKRSLLCSPDNDVVCIRLENLLRVLTMIKLQPETCTMYPCIRSLEIISFEELHANSHYPLNYGVH